MDLKNASVTEKKKMDGMGAMDKNLSGVVSISRGETLTNTQQSKNKAGKWRDYKTQGKQAADNVVRGKGWTKQDIGLATTSHLR